MMLKNMQYMLFKTFQQGNIFGLLILHVLIDGKSRDF